MRVLVVLIGLGVAQASVRAQCTAVTSTQEMLRIRMAREDVVQEMEANGFRWAAKHTFLEHQYFLVFKLKGD